MVANILVDADVIIHFHKGDRISLLRDLFPGRLFVLDTIVSELTKGKATRVGSTLENMIRWGIISEMPFPKDIQVITEYAKLSSRLGKGESACLAVCRYHNEVIASSNLRDIKDYCNQHSIAFLTTIDILCIGVLKGKITEAGANDFISLVISQQSKLPKGNIEVHLHTFDRLKLQY